MTTAAGLGQELRLFFAVPLAPELRPPVEELQRRMAQAAVRVKWVEPENLHFTLKFLGETPKVCLPRICAIGHQVARTHSCFSVHIGGIGAFPRPDQVRVVWVGCRSGGEGFAALAGALEEALAREGLASPERRPFQSHLTIGRCRNPERSSALARAIVGESGVEIGSVMVTRFALFQSELRPTGPVYTVLEEFPLGSCPHGAAACGP